MKIGTLFLCRYNSSRLPGKILKPLGDKPILQHIYNKLLLVVPKETIYVTTSVEKTDDIIEDYCNEHDINCYRGDLINLSNRFLSAAKDLGFDFITRINGDAPFINMNMYAQMLVACRTNKFDFISNVNERTFPVGMSAETLRTSFFEKIQPEIQADPYFYEHVTSYLYVNQNVGKRHYIYNTRYPELNELHLAVDEQKDYDLAQRIVKELGEKYYYADFEDYCKVIKKIKEDYKREGIEWTHTFSRKELLSHSKVKK